MCLSDANEMLVELERESREARRQVIERFVPDRLGRRIIERLLDGTTTRPLMELELNGCTTFQATRMLMAEALVKPSVFRARANGFRGEECESIELTQLGYAAMFAEREGLEDNRWVSQLKGAIVGYSCIDYGSGICVTRDRLEAALELPDPEILRRCVRSTTGERQFPHAAALQTRIDDEARASSAHWWSSVAGVKRSGRVLDLSA